MSTERYIDKVIAELDTLLKAGEDEKAEETLIKAIDRHIEAEPEDVVGQSVLWNELGSFYRSRGVLDKGEQAFLKAKELLERIRGYVYTVDASARTAGCCTCGGHGCDTAFEKSVDGEPRGRVEILYGNESMTANYATTLNNLAGLYRMDKRFPEALDLFDAAIRVYEGCAETVSPDYFASGYNNKGLVYLDMRDTARARAMFRRAEEILGGNGAYKFAMGTTLSNLGFAAVMEGERSEAENLFRKAKTLFEETGSEDMARSCEELLSRIEAAE